MLTGPTPPTLRLHLTLAAIFGAVAVAAGAFAAHGLEAWKGPGAVDLWRTAAGYQLAHAVVLVALAVLRGVLAGADRILSLAGWLFAAGCLLFPGALYLLGIGAPKWLGAVAPMGGACFILGWLCLGLAAWRSR